MCINKNASNHHYLNKRVLIKKSLAIFVHMYAPKPLCGLSAPKTYATMGFRSQRHPSAYNLFFTSQPLFHWQLKNREIGIFTISSFISLCFSARPKHDRDG